MPDEPPKAISQADLERLLEMARASGARDYAIVCVLADTGCRVGGLVGLRLGDLDLGRRRAVVREKGRGGKRKSRTIYLGKKTVEVLRLWLKVRPDRPDDDRVFLSQRGALTEAGVYQVLKRLAKQAGIRGGSILTPSDTGGPGARWRTAPTWARSAKSWAIATSA